MRYSNIAKVDSKGRILIPSHIRKTLGLEEGTELIIIPDQENLQAKIFPLIKGRTAELRIVMDDVPGSLAKIANILAMYNASILMSQSKTLVRKRLAEWDIIVDISECNGNIESIKEKLSKTDVIKKMEFVTI